MPDKTNGSFGEFKGGCFDRPRRIGRRKKGGWKLSYKEWIGRISKRNRSGIVLALDLEVADPKDKARCMKTVRETAPYICAVKLGFQLVLSLGIYDGCQEIIGLAHELDLPVIMDCKATDVGHMNKIVAEHYFKAGFDALTASPLVGWREGLEPMFKLARKMGKGILLLVYMSHAGAGEGFDQMIFDSRIGKIRPQYELFASRALEWEADGIIVGATYPDKIVTARKIVGDAIPIYSPGIGTQGGKIEEAIEAGARYLIIGRSIVRAEYPGKVAEEVADVYRSLCFK